MTGQWWSDDDQLLSALDHADRVARAVPRRFVELGKAAYTWHGRDAELAALTFDSAREEVPVPVASRSESAPLRTLTFVSEVLTIDVEVTSESLLGQLVPPQPADLEVHGMNDRVVAAGVDEVGCFIIRPIPVTPFRLHCRTADGADVFTSWVSL